MKLAIVVLSALSIVAVSAVSEEEAVNALNELKKVCMANTGATQEDVQSILNMEIPQTRPGECVAACLAKGLDLMSDNKLNVEAIRNLNLDPAFMGTIEACGDVTDADECTAARKIIECVVQHL